MERGKANCDSQESFTALSEISKGSGEVGSRRVPARVLFCVAGYHVAVMKVSSQLSPHAGRGMAQHTQIPGLSAFLSFPSPQPQFQQDLSIPLSAVWPLKTNNKRMTRLKYKALADKGSFGAEATKLIRNSL